MAEDPFVEEELPEALSTERNLNALKNEMRESKISIAVSNASGVVLEIGKIGDSKKEDGDKKGLAESSCEEVNNPHEVCLLLEDKEEVEDYYLRH